MFDEAELKKIAAAQKKWESENKGEFAKETKEFVTQEGVPLKRVYTPLDLAAKNFDYLKDMGFPGQYPFTRGNSPTMYRTKPWTMSQIGAYGGAKETNKLWKALLAKGVNIFYILQDMPSQCGYDPDHPLSRGEVGKVGISLFSLRDLEKAFEGIDVGAIPVQIQANTDAAVKVAMWLAVAKQRGIDISKLRGQAQNDMLKEYCARNTYRFPVRPALRLSTDLISYCAKHVPGLVTVGFQTYPYGERGADRVLQAAYCFADAIEYMNNMVSKGVDIDVAAPTFNFFTGVNPEGFFEELAKLRAMRKVWAKLMKERFKAKDPRSWMLRQYIHGQGVAMVRPQPVNNITRSALACLVAAFAGGETINLITQVEAWGVPTEEAITVTLRTQQIIGFESGICNVADPLAGSYFIESLTCEYEKRIWKELDDLDAHGGMVKAIENGYIQSKLLEATYKRQRAIEKGDLVKVCLNKFYEGEGKPNVAIYSCDPAFEKERINDLKELKKTRDNRKVRRALDDLRVVAKMKESKDSNLMPPVIAAVEAYATTGEICGVLEQVWGKFEQPAFV